MQAPEGQANPGRHLYTLKSASSSGIELQFFLLGSGPHASMLLLTHQPLRPKEPPHQGRLSLSAFAELTRALLSAGGARPTLDLSGGQVKLHLTTRSRRPGRLSVRSEDSLEVLNFSPLNPVAEEFQNVLERATALAQAPGETSLPGP